MRHPCTHGFSGSLSKSCFMIHTPTRLQSVAQCITAALLGSLLLAPVLGCGDTKDARDDNPDDTPPTWEDDPTGEWLSGDLHVHSTDASNDTGGDSTPEAIAQKAQELGLFFVVMTDHSNSTGSDTTTTDEDPDLFNQGPEFVHWDKAKELSIPDEFILVSGNEISPVDVDEKDPRGHIGCIPRTLSDDFDTDSPFIDRPRGVVSSADAIQQALDRGCFTILNHPYAVTPWIASDWTSFDYEAMEVWNGGANSLDLFDTYGWDAFRCDLLAGRKVTPVAASDNHRVYHEGGLLDPPLGRPKTSVFATERTWDAIIEGLDAGLVAMGEGDSIVKIDMYDAEGRRTEGEDARYIRVRGALDAQSRKKATLRVTRATSCVDLRPSTTEYPKVSEERLLSETIEPGHTFEFVIPIEAEAGVYTATLLTGKPTPIGGAFWSAMSRAITIEP